MPLPSIGNIDEPWLTSHRQLKATTISSAAPAIAPCRESNRSNGRWARTGAASRTASVLVDDTTLGDVQLGELGVGGAQLDIERTFRAGPALADLAGVILKP